MEYRINGRRYNPKTAKYLRSFDNRGITHFELYRKRTGEYFILGYSYDASHDFFDHCVPVGVGLCWGIIPNMNEKQMQKFCGVGLDFWK